jgi:hypothetical protein
MCWVTWEEQCVPKRSAHMRPSQGLLLFGMPSLWGCCQRNHWQIFCFHFSPDTHWASWKKKNNQRPCIMDNKTPAQWEEQAFHFCKALLDYFSVKVGTPIFGNKIPSQREGFPLHTDGIMYRRRAWVQALPHLRSLPDASRPREPLENDGRACTQVLFLRKAELGFVHFLEIVTGWLVPSTIEDPACWKQVPSGR